MGCGVGLGIIRLVSIFDGVVEEGECDGDGDIVFSAAAGRKSASKSGEVGYRDEVEDCGESWANGVSVSLMVAAVGGVSWTMVTTAGDAFGVQSDRGAGDGTSCAKVNGSAGPLSCVVSAGGCVVVFVYRRVVGVPRG